MLFLTKIETTYQAESSQIPQLSNYHVTEFQNQSNRLVNLTIQLKITKFPIGSFYTKYMRRQTIILPLLIFFLVQLGTGQKVQQLTPSKLEQSIQNNQFTLVYFYSATCKFCQIFTPKFDHLAKMNNVTGVVYGKIDGPAYKDLTQRLQIYSYPMIGLFWKGIDQPIFFRKEREIPSILEFLRSNTQLLKNFVTKETYEKLTEQQKNMGILYFGPLDSNQYNITTVLSKLEVYRPFGVYQANVTQPYIEIKQKQYYNFDIKQLRSIIHKQFAKLHEITEEAWLKIHEQKTLGIVYVETKTKPAVVDLLKKLAVEYPELVFMKIDSSQDQYRDAINSLGVEWEENIYGVDKKYDVKFVAPRPYTEQSLKQFITKSLNLSAKIYHRSQKTSHKQKLTNANFQQKVIKQPKDVILFLYKEQDRIHARFMDLFKFLTEKLKQNKNISLLRCNLSKNDIQSKLEFQVKVTPSIVYYGHRMKDKPVHFTKSVISAGNVIEFIMENTTFDWEDQWGEL